MNANCRRRYLVTTGAECEEKSVFRQAKGTSLSSQYSCNGCTIV